MSAPEYIVKQKWQKQHYIWASIAGLIGVVILLSIGYYGGNQHGLNLVTENRQLEASTKEQAITIDELENELVMLKQTNQVEQATNAEAGQAMEVQQRRIRELERELSFYRNILAPQETIKGLQVSQFQKTMLKPNRITWQISLLQAGSTGRVLSGLVSIDLIYSENGEESREPVLTVSGNKNFGFKFRYFQNISGEIELLPQRTPIAFEVQAKQYGQDIEPVIKRFPWEQPLESITDVE